MTYTSHHLLECLLGLGCSWKLQELVLTELKKTYNGNYWLLSAVRYKKDLERNPLNVP